MPPRKTATRTATRDSVRSNGNDEAPAEVKPAIAKRAAAAKGKKAAANGKGRDKDKDNSDSDDSGGDNDTIPFDPTEFESRPLDRHHGAALNANVSDWERNVKLAYEKKLFPMIAEIASSSMDLIMQDTEKTDADAREVLDKLDPLMREMLDLEAEAKIHIAVLREMDKKLGRGESFDDAVAAWDKGAEEKLKERLQQTSRQKYAQDKYYTKFRQEIWSAQNPGTAMPPVSGLIPKESGDDGDDDDDVQVGGVTQDFKCPISLTQLTDPVTSTSCKHSFNREAIRDYLRQGPKKCPASGCSKVIKIAELEDDEDLKRRAKQHFQRMERVTRNVEVEDISEDELDD